MSQETQFAMNQLAEAFTIAHRMGHERPDVPENERKEFRRIAQLIWAALARGEKVRWENKEAAR